MTPKQALEILSAATEPQNIRKITRDGYAQISQALYVISQLVQADDSKSET